jgi:hypothetical protein
MISSQPKDELTCDYGRDIALVGLEVIDSNVVSSISESVGDWNSLHFSFNLRLKATIVNKGAPIDNFSINGRSISGYFCSHYWSMQEEIYEHMETGDTLVLDSLILDYPHGVYEFDDSDPDYYHFEINRPLVVGTPDWKQDVNISDNTLFLHFEMDFLLTDTDDVPAYASSIRLVPNPAINQFQIVSEGQYGISTYTVYDLRGGKWLSGTGGNEIDCGNLSAGLYLVDINLKNGDRVVKKLIVQ